MGYTLVMSKYSKIFAVFFLNIIVLAGCATGNEENVTQDSNTENGLKLEDFFVSFFDNKELMKYNGPAAQLNYSASTSTLYNVEQLKEKDYLVSISPESCKTLSVFYKIDKDTLDQEKILGIGNATFQIETANGPDFESLADTGIALAWQNLIVYKNENEAKSAFDEIENSFPECQYYKALTKNGDSLNIDGGTGGIEGKIDPNMIPKRTGNTLWLEKNNELFKIWQQIGNVNVEYLFFTSTEFGKRGSDYTFLNDIINSTSKKIAEVQKINFIPLDFNSLKD
jgi:hypothetical protein